MQTGTIRQRCVRAIYLWIGLCTVALVWRWCGLNVLRPLYLFLWSTGVSLSILQLNGLAQAVWRRRVSRGKRGQK